LQSPVISILNPKGGPELELQQIEISTYYFNGMQNKLESLSSRKLQLYGQGSLLGVDSKSGIKTALKNKTGAETFGFVCCRVMRVW